MSFPPGGCSSRPDVNLCRGAVSVLSPSPSPPSADAGKLAYSPLYLSAEDQLLTLSRSASQAAFDFSGQ